MKCFYYRLKEYYKSRGEKPIFMFSIIHLLKYYDQVDWKNNTRYEEFDVSSDFISDMFQKRKNLEIDSYAIDMHTSEKDSKNKVDFVTEGSLVLNECKRFYVEEWRKNYIEMELKKKKKIMENKRMEKYKK